MLLFLNRKHYNEQSYNGTLHIPTNNSLEWISRHDIPVSLCGVVWCDVVMVMMACVF